MFSYTIQIYFDFSGYCDMAIGIRKMFNIELPVNFNSPYKAATIAEFGKRWHITQTRFFTMYLYIPLSGNRKGKARTYLNMFLVSGLWHGASWTLVLWGGVHGVAVVGNRAFKVQIEKVPRTVNWVLTFVFVNLSWIIFRGKSLTDVIGMLRTPRRIMLRCSNICVSW